MCVCVCVCVCVCFNHCYDFFLKAAVYRVCVKGKKRVECVFMSVCVFVCVCVCVCLGGEKGVDGVTQQISQKSSLQELYILNVVFS